MIKTEETSEDVEPLIKEDHKQEINECMQEAKDNNEWGSWFILLT